jgi:hypothetical protein
MNYMLKSKDTQDDLLNTALGMTAPTPALLLFQLSLTLRIGVKPLLVLPVMTKYCPFQSE